MSACGGGMQLVLNTAAASDECLYDCGSTDVMFAVCEIIMKLSGSEAIKFR